VSASAEMDLNGLRTDLLMLHRDAARLRAQNAQLVASNNDLIAQLTEATQTGGKHLRTLVAFHQLLDGGDVAAGVRNVCDIVINIIGSESFVIVGVNARGTARVVAGYGSALERARAGEQTLDALSADALRVVDLKLGTRNVGAIVIDALLPHRDGFHQADEDVLQLLSKHAATAIIAAAEWRRWAHLPLPELA
jgi:hypothetical protein